MSSIYYLIVNFQTKHIYKIVSFQQKCLNSMEITERPLVQLYLPATSNPLQLNPNLPLDMTFS